MLNVCVKKHPQDQEGHEKISAIIGLTFPRQLGIVIILSHGAIGGTHSETDDDDGQAA
jgi:hypothetical protein